VPQVEKRLSDLEAAASAIKATLTPEQQLCATRFV
jgi:hypothetical protein